MFQIVLWDNFRDFVSCRCRIVKIDGENKSIILLSLLLMMLLSDVGVMMMGGEIVSMRVSSAVSVSGVCQIILWFY